MGRVFTLKVDHSQSIDDIPNIHKINLEDYQDLSQILASEKHSFSDKIIAKANFSQLPNFDFITNDFNIPVLSQKIIDLTQIDKIEEITIVPVYLIDDTYLKPFSKKDVLDNKIPISKNVYSLKFVKRLDYCNRELSSFRKLRSKPNELGILKKPVLNIPDSGFPDMFRIKESISLFVSEKFKNIVELNNLKGFVFEEVETIGRWGSSIKSTVNKIVKTESYKKDSFLNGLSHFEKIKNSFQMNSEIDNAYEYGAVKIYNHNCILEISLDRYYGDLSIYFTNPKTNKEYSYGMIMNQRRVFEKETKSQIKSEDENIETDLKDIAELMEKYCSDILSGDFTSLEKNI